MTGPRRELCDLVQRNHEGAAAQLSRSGFSVRQMQLSHDLPGSGQRAVAPLTFIDESHR